MDFLKGRVQRDAAHKHQKSSGNHAEWLLCDPSNDSSKTISARGYILLIESCQLEAKNEECPWPARVLELWDPLITPVLVGQGGVIRGSRNSRALAGWLALAGKPGLWNYGIP